MYTDLDSRRLLERDLNPVRLASSRPTTSTRNIEEIRVGDRVIAHNPEVSSAQREAMVEPDWSQWIKLTLEMPKQDGQLLHIEMIRPESWLLERMSFISESQQKPVAKQKEALVDHCIDQQYVSPDYFRRKVSIVITFLMLPFATRSGNFCFQDIYLRAWASNC